MKASEIIRKAKKYLWDGRDMWFGIEHVCFAIDHVTYTECLDDVAANRRAKGLIDSQIHPHRTVKDWLFANGVDRTEFKNTERMQAYRLAWMDRLIAEFEAKGD